MNAKKQVDKNELLAVLFMAGLFILVHGLALVMTSPFESAGLQPAFEEKDDPFNVLYIIVIMLAVTGLILLIAKFFKKYFIQIIILGSIGYTSFYGFFLPLLTLVLPKTAPELLLIFLAAILGIIFVYILYKFPEWYIIDISGVIVGVAAIIIFGISLGVFLVILLLLGLAVYDAISVYKTKHMIDLADTVMDLKLPVLLVIPKIRHYSLIKETKRLKEKLKDNDERDAFFMGLGDVVMPGILVIAVYSNIPDALPIALSVILGTLAGFAVLMSFVIKGKPQAGLPCLCGGAILGYIISSLVLHGKLIGLHLPNFSSLF